MSPAISVVVCIYNVERYLRECLDSIANQSFVDFECILCDDESTDASGLIAQSFADKDPRFTYVHQKNRGPGPSGGRNGGIPYITGDRILFVDSDDILVPDALEVMYNSAEATGSEMVIGGVDRFNSSSRWPSYLHQRAHIEELQATSVEAFPDMVWDCTAWNKLISTRLWQEHIEFFEEGRTYEDLYPMIRLMCLANSVDLLDQVIYLWRDRENQSSVTQEVASPRGLIDKVDQMLKLDRFLVDNGHDAAKRAQDHKILNFDLVWILNDLDIAGPEFQTAFWNDVPKLVEAMDPQVRASSPEFVRQQCDLIAASDREGLNRLRRSSSIDRDVTQDRLDSGDHSDRTIKFMFGRAKRVAVEGDEIVVSGYAALDRLRLKRGEGNLVIWFESWETGRRIEVPATLMMRPRLHLGRQGPQVHLNTGFEARIKAHELTSHRVPVGNIMVGARLETPHFAGSGRLFASRSLERTYPLQAGSVTVRSVRSDLNKLALKVSQALVADAIDVEGGDLNVRFERGAVGDVSLYDPGSERRWMASKLDVAAHVLRFDLTDIPSGDYLLQMYREGTSPVDSWVPLAGASTSQTEEENTFTVGDRVARLHRGPAGVRVEIANAVDDLQDVHTSSGLPFDAQMTELARHINKYTWI